MVTQWSNVMKRRQVLPRGIPRYHDAETHDAKPQDTHQRYGGLSIHHGNTESRQNLEQKFIVHLDTLSLRGINERFSFH